MKKKLMIVGTVVITIAIIVLLVLFLNKTKYIVRVSIVDDQSPDRILTVYKNDTEKIEVKRIELTDGTVLCNGYNTTVHFGDIEKEKDLRVILKDNSVVMAKIIIEEVK